VTGSDPEGTSWNDVKQWWNRNILYPVERWYDRLGLESEANFHEHDWADEDKRLVAEGRLKPEEVVSGRPKTADKVIAGAAVAVTVLAAGHQAGGTEEEEAAEKTTLAEAKKLMGQWEKSTFKTRSDSLAYHFGKHGADVGATNILQYMRKASAFAQNLKRATVAHLDTGATRYTKNGRYIILSAERKILSFGRE
jgi:hypothetical protein